jgi:hypothetical protein
VFISLHLCSCCPGWYVCIASRVLLWQQAPPCCSAVSGYNTSPDHRASWPAEHLSVQVQLCMHVVLCYGILTCCIVPLSYRHMMCTSSDGACSCEHLGIGVCRCALWCCSTGVSSDWFVFMRGLMLGVSTATVWLFSRQCPRLPAVGFPGLNCERFNHQVQGDPVRSGSTRVC